MHCDAQIFSISSMATTEAVDLRARALEQRQAELDRAAKVVGKHHGHDALRLQVSRLLHSQLLDYRHNSPANLKKSVSLLLRLCQNVVEHPEDEKYRKVTACCLFPVPFLASGTSCFVLTPASLHPLAGEGSNDRL